VDVDRLEHGVDVVGVELVEPQVTEVRFEVEADVAGVAGAGAEPQVLASVQPAVEPRADGEAAVEWQVVPVAPPDGLGVG